MNYDLELLKYQEKVDEKYGKGEWRVIFFEGLRKPVVVEHECGERKTITRATNFIRNSYICRSCQQTGRPKISFEEMDKRIKEATYNTYELVELIDSTDFVVNHKSCDRKPFRTSVPRFFSRGQRCACKKRGVVGRKPKEDVVK